MDDHRGDTDVMAVLVRMRPSLDQLGADWPQADRKDVLDRVLANPGGRRRSGRWTGWVGASVAAAAVLLVVLVVPRWPGGIAPIEASPAVSRPVGSLSPAAPVMACQELDDRERNDVGKMNQIYHGVDPEDGVVASAKVDAGDGYSVIGSRLTTGQTTAWLSWETDFSVTSEGEVSYALHLAEITTGDAWDGGAAPYGRQALAAVLPCVA